ncbi:uncharacterized protein MONBRDRAFT_30751 [Monosiga brevicollis MX1]|uniref:WW domain-containing protein n=1 Tax=Monosiga brevicollis TaxID=81824 RepID=A9UNZ5_MONBE|nr:uncharacterized protein MONBRDRAFT_30751 [Monosiga brevicollis MX1]EDQ92330.1 predicted protein [Monosiga brevicollis MX1]|eukprot:XP_001742092.1 hypothetical protein [Monosiga brevicollis MX1]
MGPDSPLAAGNVGEGDVLLSLNGCSLVDVSNAEAARLQQALVGSGQVHQRLVTLDTQGASPGISFVADAARHVRILSVVPGSVAATAGVQAGSQRSRSLHRTGSYSSLGSNFTEDPIANINDLLQAVEASHHRLTAAQRATIRQLCEPDSAGLVTRHRFQRAYDMVMHGPSSISGQQSRASFVSDVDMDGSFAPTRQTDAGSSIIDPTHINLSGLDDETPRLQSQLLAARETIERLQKENANLKNREKYERSAATQSRQIERDYDEIVALLEAEIAHLRAQLRAGPDEKDTQLMHLRQRVLVLGVQLNKAVHGRQASEAALEKLRDFANRTLRRMIFIGNYGPRFADKSLALRSDGTLQYRPSDGPLPPTAPWAVGDVCRAPHLYTGMMTPAVIESIHVPVHASRTEVQVRFLQYEDVPELEVVSMDALEPLSEEDFVVAAARHGRLAQAVTKMETTKANTTLNSSFTKTEREIESDCRRTLETVGALLEDTVLPFGWESAYTADGLKYYIDHTTQTTSWKHPTSQTDRAINAVAFNDRERAIEADYIRRHEARIREMKQKEKSAIASEREEILALAKQAKSQHVKELLQDLADHIPN